MVSELVLFVLAIHQPFYMSICISTLPTQHTMFIYKIGSVASNVLRILQLPIL